MNLNQLRFAKAVADTRSFSKAASLCCVTQPALSNSVAQLEEELGGPLFHRTTRRVALTRFGERIIPLVEQALAGVTEIEATAKVLLNPEAGVVRIGFSPIVDIPRVASRLDALRRTHPQVEVLYKQCFVSELEDLLARGQIDIAILLAEEDASRGRQCVELYREELMFLPRGSSTERVDSSELTLASVSQEQFVIPADLCGLASATRRLFASGSLELSEYRGQALSYEAMQECTDLGFGAAVLPRSKLSRERLRRARKLYDSEGQPLTLPLAATWRETAVTPPHVRAVLELLSRTEEAGTQRK